MSGEHWAGVVGATLALLAAFSCGYVEGTRNERRRAALAVKRAWRRAVGLN